MISISKLREKLGISTAEDGDLRDILDGMVGLWEEETKRLWSRRAGYVENIRIDTSKRMYTLFLKLWPIETITKVEERALTSTTWTELTADQYLLVDPTRNRLERIGCSWPAMVRVTYTGGYVADPAAGADPAQNKTPLEIQDAMILQEKFKRERNVPGRIMTQSQNFEGGAGVFLRPDLHPLYAELVSHKKRKV